MDLNIFQKCTFLKVLGKVHISMQCSVRCRQSPDCGVSGSRKAVAVRMTLLLWTKWFVARGAKPSRQGSEPVCVCVQVMLLVVIGFIALSYYCVAILTCGSTFVSGSPLADKLWAAVAFSVFTLLVSSLLAEGASLHVRCIFLSVMHGANWPCLQSPWTHGTTCIDIRGGGLDRLQTGAHSLSIAVHSSC